MVNKPKNLSSVSAPPSGPRRQRSWLGMSPPSSPKSSASPGEPHDSAEKEEEEEWEEEEEEESSEHFPADFVGTPQTARGAERI